MDNPIHDPPVPYIGPIHGERFSPGKFVKIRGATPSTAYRFNVNLQCGSETTPAKDIPMQVAIRILDGYISLNSLQCGEWGEEQRCITLPIRRAEKFEIILKCGFNQYEVVINDQHICDFPQRIHYDLITHLAIDGDVSIIQILYTSGAEDPVSRGAVVSAPIQALQNETDDFELIDSNTITTSCTNLYDSAGQRHEIGFVSGKKWDAAPPYPTELSSVIISSGTAYGTSGTIQTVVPVTKIITSDSPDGTPEIPPPAPNAVTPLTAREIEMGNKRRFGLLICGFTVGIILLSFVAITKT